MQSILPLDFDPYRNRGLFADHYLDDQERLRAMPEWGDDSGLSEAFGQILQLYTSRASRFSTRTNEQQTERDFVRPVLDILWRDQTPGDAYEVQVSIPNLDVRRQPDYAFFRNGATRNVAEPRKGTIEYWRDVPVLGDAKAWMLSLDKQRGYDENPSAQICNYLYRSRVRWGILTNGRIWRLYEREKSSAGGIFFEVNLEDLLSSGNLETFKYFYFFFRREAFRPDDSGASFVEKVFKESTRYATEVGDRLKESVYDALRLLMNGIFDYSANGLDRHDPDTLKAVHTDALIVLYRLLFLLYAEDRKLLPCDNEHYKDYCLQAQHKLVNANLRNHHSYLRQSNSLWSSLLNLFHLIDVGVPEADIPAYNGGLFNPTKHPHIAYAAQAGYNRWEVGDSWVAQAVDMLAYERERWNEPGSEDIDYNTLGVQHLGSIYEGLLELKPSIADEDLVEVLDDGKSVYKPVREVPNPRQVHRQEPRRIAAGEVYLVTNRGERKASGSYYTPKYIVDYIVENTVGSLVDDAARKVAELRPEVEKEIKRLEKRAKEFASNTAEVEKSRQGIEAQKRLLLEPYLTLKILDPAMGSGHFLVGASDTFSLAMTTDPNLLPLEDIGEEEEQAYYKRLAVERCLYGVDLNPLSVELAKLSLWLHTVSKDKALSFLDHHLRCGNSLIGARVEDDLMKPPPLFNDRGKRVLPRDPNQTILGFNETLRDRHLKPMLGLLQQISEIPTQDVSTEKVKENLWNELERIRPHYRAVANCWLAPFFGQSISADQYQQAVDALHTAPDWKRLEAQPWFQAAQAIADEKQFFHWELEFPEIFFDPNGLKPNEWRGFDAVIGNPPYGSILDTYAKHFVESTFLSAQYQLDNYIAFMEQTNLLTRQAGFESLIVPTTFIAMHNFSAIRKFLLDHCQLRMIVHFRFPVFEDPTVESALYICQSAMEQDERNKAEVHGNIYDSLIDFLTDRGQSHLVQQIQFLTTAEYDFNFWVAENSIISRITTSNIEELRSI
jgi:type I restriction-modification system DNA methylase subunit